MLTAFIYNILQIYILSCCSSSLPRPIRGQLVLRLSPDWASRSLAELQGSSSILLHRDVTSAWRRSNA